MSASGYSLPFRCLIPSQLIGLLIGKGGANLKDLRCRAQAYIEIERSLNLPIADQVMTIIGSGSAKIEAVKLIIRNIRKLQRTVPTAEVNDLFVLLIPARGVPILQNALTQIAQETGIPPIGLRDAPLTPDFSFHPVILQGDAEHVSVASGRIYMLLSTALRSGELIEQDFEHPNMASGADAERLLRIVPPPPQALAAAHAAAHAIMYQQQQYLTQQPGTITQPQHQPPTVTTAAAIPILEPGKSPLDAYLSSLDQYAAALPPYEQPNVPIALPKGMRAFPPMDLPFPDTPVVPAGQETKFFLRLPVPEEIGLWIIGRGGTNVRFLSNLTGANLKFDQAPQRPPIHERERQVRIMGSALSKRLAARLVLDQIAERSPVFGHCPLRICIPSHSVEKILPLKSFIETKITGSKLYLGANGLPLPDDPAHTEKLILVYHKSYRVKLQAFFLLLWGLEQLFEPALQRIPAPPVPPPLTEILGDAMLPPVARDVATNLQEELVEPSDEFAQGVMRRVHQGEQAATAELGDHHHNGEESEVAQLIARLHSRPTPGALRLLEVATACSLVFDDEALLSKSRVSQVVYFLEDAFKLVQMERNGGLMRHIAVTTNVEMVVEEGEGVMLDGGEGERLMRKVVFVGERADVTVALAHVGAEVDKAGAALEATGSRAGKKEEGMEVIDTMKKEEQ